MSRLLLPIQALLDEPIATAAERERRTLPGLLSGADGSVVLFGAGRLGRLCARALRRAGIPLRAFCDGHPGLPGGMVEGIAVMPPAEAAEKFGSSALFVVAIWTGTARESMVERIAYLRGLGCRQVTTYAPLVWAHGREETPFHSFDLPTQVLARAGEIRRLAGLLGDEESRRVLLAALRQRLLGEFAANPPAPDQYFPSDLVALRADEVMVDGGAFDGDTLQAFLERSAAQFREYHAFEPDPANADRLRRRIGTLPQPVRGRISVHQIALHSHEAELDFAGQGAPTSRLASGGASRVPGRALDQVLGAARRVTFLKLDVEGAEQEALRGAQRVLAEQRPLVAVCVYHGPADLWEIPLPLQACLPGHRLYLRQHSFDGWETVCYAIPPER